VDLRGKGRQTGNWTDGKGGKGGRGKGCPIFLENNVGNPSHNTGSLAKYGTVCNPNIDSSKPLST